MSNALVHLPVKLPQYFPQGIGKALPIRIDCPIMGQHRP